jgi:hypothetical protein
MTRACFVDFDFPRRCGTWSILEIVAADEETCVDSRAAFATGGGALESCDIVLGLESSLVAAFGGKTGPTYNYSGVGALLPSPAAPTLTGWEFLMPFSWGVWLVFIGCAVAAFGSQLLMRWLDFRRKKTSPTYVITEDEEKSFDLVMASFTALINATRLYTYYHGPYFRHLASMVMAIFSVFFVSLYSSNLTAFMFPNRRPTLGAATKYGVHWGISDRAETLVPRGATVAFATSAAVPPGTILVAPDIWLDCAAGTFVSLAGTVVYPVMFARWYAASRETSARIAAALSNQTWPASACSAAGSGETAVKLQLKNVWGLFVLAAAGHVAAIAMTVCRGPRDFRWFSRKSPVANEHDTLDTVDASMRPCRKSEDVTRVDMFELSRSWSTSNNARQS